MRQPPRLPPAGRAEKSPRRHAFEQMLACAQLITEGVVERIDERTVVVGGRAIHANSAGTAKVPAGSGKVTAPGYVVATFRVR